jgi:hypothetical protein
LAVSHILPLGATVFDTTKLTETGGDSPTGTVIYTFFHSGDCTAKTATSTDKVTIGGGGAVPHSSNQGPLGSGRYAFEAEYSSDANYLAGTSECEPLSVDKAPLGFSTTVFDASTNKPISGTLAPGATVFDTSKLTTTSGITPTGTVTYAFFQSGTCTTGTAVGSDTVTIGADGSVPASSIHGPLGASPPYAFEAEYSSDANFLGTGSGCEPFDASSSTASSSAPALTSSTPSSGSLASTGLAVTLYALVATALIGAGVGLVRLTRRKPARGAARHTQRRIR